MKKKKKPTKKNKGLSLEQTLLTKGIGKGYEKLLKNNSPDSNEASSHMRRIV